MAPKKAATGTAEGVDSTAAGTITALCRLIMTNESFKADNAKLAPLLGMAQAKNVPRKINSMLNPYGFDFKGGKIIAQDGTQAQDGAAGPGGNTSAAEDGKDDKKNKAPKASKTTAKARPSKKRKLADSFPDEDDSDHVKGEDVEEE